MPKLIRNTYAGWVSSNPVLALEDTGFERDTGRSKVGDGVKAWNDLNYFNEISGGPAGPAGRSPIDPVEFGDPVTARLRHEIVPGGALQGVFFDDFAVNTLADVSRYPFGSLNYSFWSDVLRSSKPTPLFTSFTSSDDLFVSIRSGDSRTGPFILPLILATSDDSWLYLYHYGTTLVLQKRIAGVYYDLSSISVPTAVNGDFVYLSKQGSTIVCERYTTDPMVGSAVLKGSFTYQLTSAELAIFGGVLRAGVRGQVDGQYSYGDILRAGLRPLEQRRLIADVDHPAGGVISTVLAKETPLEVVKPLPSRSLVNKATAQLAAGAREVATVGLGKSFRLMAVSTNRPARVRLYSTVAKRDADLARAVGTAPAGDHGVIAEVVLTAADLDISLNPQALGSNLEAPSGSTIALTVDNLDAVAGIVNTTFTIQELEV